MKREDQQNEGLPPDEHPPEGVSVSRIEKDDPRLLDAAVRGDIKAFADLFEPYRPALLALCLKRLEDSSLAEDVVQEVFIKAFSRLPNSDYRKPMWPWLATIGIRMCIDLQRRRSFTHFSEDIGSAVDSDAKRGTLDAEAGSALDAVIASEKRAELLQSLRVLSRRQRRVFLLYALDGWSCAEIAEAEGISVHAVHHLLFRARKKMRATHQTGPLALVPLPFIWVRSRLQEAEERIRMLLGPLGDRLSGTGTAAVSLGVLALIAATVSHSVESSEGGDAVRPDEPAVSITQTRPSQTSALQTTFPNIGASNETYAEPEQSVADPASSLVGNVINPNESATPENTHFTSIMASPNYENDHTILLLGSHSRGSVIFISRDGGANWNPLPSRLLFGYTMVIPPSYPRDRRIFAAGWLGLQQSDDGGEIFRTVSPLAGWNLAISPSFGRGDSRILIGGSRIFEYDAETGVTQPALLNLLLSNGTSYSPTFSPGYPSDPTVFVSKDTAPPLYRCKRSVCDVVQFPSTDWRVTLRLSPRFDEDGMAYAFAGKELFISNDGARTFRELQFPLSDKSFISDVTILRSASSGPAIFIVSDGVYRSLDGRQSWSSLGIDVPGIRDYGANQLIVTPTGRLLATGKYGGIACSPDGGQTWRPRCTAEL